MPDDAFGAHTLHTPGPNGIWGDGDEVNTPQAASAVGNPCLFTGRRYDPETGLYDYRARMYHPALGRFMQPDPIGYYDSMNLYQYCGNDPVNWVDPWGLISWGSIAKGMGKIAGGIGAMAAIPGMVAGTSGIGALAAVGVFNAGSYLIAAGLADIVCGIYEKENPLPQTLTGALLLPCGEDASEVGDKIEQEILPGTATSKAIQEICDQASDCLDEIEKENKGDPTDENPSEKQTSYGNNKSTKED